jgi:hypothetical protein
MNLCQGEGMHPFAYLAGSYRIGQRLPHSSLPLPLLVSFKIYIDFPIPILDAAAASGILLNVHKNTNITQIMHGRHGPALYL